MTSICPSGRHLTGYQHVGESVEPVTHKARKVRLTERYRYSLTLLLLIADLVCVWFAVSHSMLTGTPQWMVTVAFLMGALVLPMGIWHLLIGD